MAHLEFKSTIIHIFLEGLLCNLLSHNMNCVIHQSSLCEVLLRFETNKTNFPAS